MSADAPQIVETLIVDDQPEHRKMLRPVFEVADAEDHVFEVHEAGTIEEYHELIKKRSYDVMVVDVCMGWRIDGVDDIVEFHHAFSPATIIVVCSRFVGLDLRRTCVRAIRAGAVDCIDKREDDWPRTVIDAVLDELHRRNAPDAGPTPAWLEQNLSRLAKEYPGKAVAMLGQKVVASAATVADLRAMLPSLHLEHKPFFMVVPRSEP